VYRYGPSRALRAANRLFTAPVGRRPLSRRSLRSGLASLAIDHSGLVGVLRTARARSGLKCMCPRRQRFIRSGPADLGSAYRDGRGCVAANGESAGRSLRAGQRAVLFGPPHAGALSLASRRAIAEDSERAGVTTGVHPAGFAAGCLYRAGCEHWRRSTLTEVKGAANVSAATLRTHRTSWSRNAYVLRFRL